MAPIKILVINPNTTQSMTDALRAPIESLNYNNTTYTYHTSPRGPSSINSPTDASLSATLTLPSLLPLLPHYNAFLVACYSPHPLVSLLENRTRKPVCGIFEASVWAAVQLLHNNEEEEGNGEGSGEGEEKEKDKGREKFGIVSTGDIWKEVLGNAVRRDVLGKEKAGRVFAGVETCGLDAGELHGDGEVERRVKDAVGRLVRGEDEGGKIGVVVLGCAGMVGMEEWVGSVVGEGVRVVDGVRAGVGVLQGLVRCGF